MMMCSVPALLALLLVSFTATADCQATEAAAVGPVVRGEFQSCAGCRLNHLPEVKKFLRGDIEKGVYRNVTVKFIPGHFPEFFLYDAQNREVARMFVDKLSYHDLHNLMQTKGFHKVADETAEVAAGAAAITASSTAGVQAA